MSENLSAEMPKVDDTIPSMEPDESPEDYRKRLVAASHTEPVNPDDEVLKKQALGTYRDPEPMPEEPKINADKKDDEAA